MTMKFIGSFIWGGILGTAAVLLHSAYVPVGLVLALLGSGIGIWLIGRAWGMRRYKVISAIGWVLVALRAATPSIGGELLVQGNFAGNALVVGGFVMLVLTVWAKV
jgi:hypothetical protein